MAVEGESEEITLEHTPTWAVATVCFVLITASLVIERGLHRIAQYLKKKRRASLLQALQKILSDLFLLGFISLLLTILERPISRICIQERFAESFLPCTETELTSELDEETECGEQGKVSLMSRVGVQQLQLLIFSLAFFHVMSSFLTFFVGTVKMRRWEQWEAETRTLEYQFTNDPRRFQLIHQTSFGRRHLKYWSENRILRLPASFSRQFFGSVRKVDYLTLRHGFITAHFSEETNYDFQKYIRRALEKDFKVVVGMRLWIWIFSVLFIFFSASVFHSYLWLPFFPLLMLLAVGTKLEGIITKMCLATTIKSHVVQGTLLVRPSDHLFWFGRPKYLLHLMHLILFQNSFQLAFFSWSWYEFGLRCCFHKQTEDISIKLAMGVLIPVLCGYVTLPLYALVTQMGTSIRNSVFPEQVIGGLKRWRAKARKNLALAERSLEASVNASVESYSPHTLDASPSLERGYAGEDGIGSVERSEDEIVAERVSGQDQKFGSFEGFDLSKM